MNRQKGGLKKLKLEPSFDAVSTADSVVPTRSETSTEHILEIVEKISSNCANITKEEWNTTFDLRQKDIKETISAKSVVAFFKKWSVYKDSQIYIFWDYKMMYSTNGDLITTQWEKFFIKTVPYLITNLKDKNSKLIAKQLTERIELVNTDNDGQLQFTSIYFVLQSNI